LNKWIIPAVVVAGWASSALCQQATRALTRPHRCRSRRSAGVLPGCLAGQRDDGLRQAEQRSQIAGSFNLSQADIGFHYRVRADYIRSSKDTSNLSNDSHWQYLIVET
jgi:hypothetical protein